MRRLLVSPDQIREGGVTVVGDPLHYLVRVLRLGPGDPVEIFDGTGRSWPGLIETVGEEQAEIGLGSVVIGGTPPAITLAQGLAKGDKLEWVVQKTTELGLSRFVPLQTDRCVVRLDESRGADRARRWRRIAEEAARQSGRVDVPAVDEPMGIEAFLSGATKRGEKVGVLWEQEGTQRLGTWIAAHLGEPLALIVGPEGGLSEAEVAKIVESGGSALTLGTRILRTETAGVAALSIAMHLAGELG